MPSFDHGAHCSVFANGYDLSAYFKTASVSAVADTADATGFKDTDRKYVAGLRDATLTAEGMHDADAAGAADVLAQAVGTDPVIGVVLPGGEAYGAPGIAGRFIQTAYDVTSPVDDVVSVSFEGQVTEGGERVETVHVTGLVGSGTATTVDSGAATSEGYAVWVQAPDGTGAGTVTVQHSSNGTAWSALQAIPFADIDDLSSVRVSGAGTVNRYLRCVTATSGSVSYWAGVSRRPTDI